MGGGGSTEVEDQAVKFVPLFNNKIDEMNKDQLYGEFLKRGIKEKKYIVKKYIRKLLKVSMQNRVRNVTMAKAKKKDLVNFPETATLRSLRLIKTPVVDPQNEFAVARAPKFLDDSEVQVPVKHNFDETFERDKFNRETVGRGKFHNLFTRL